MITLWTFLRNAASPDPRCYIQTSTGQQRMNTWHVFKMKTSPLCRFSISAGLKLKKSKLLITKWFASLQRSMAAVWDVEGVLRWKGNYTIQTISHIIDPDRLSISFMRATLRLTIPIRFVMWCLKAISGVRRTIYRGACVINALSCARGARPKEQANCKDGFKAWIGAAADESMIHWECTFSLSHPHPCVDHSCRNVKTESVPSSAGPFTYMLLCFYRKCGRADRPSEPLFKWSESQEEGRLKESWK